MGVEGGVVFVTGGWVAKLFGRAAPVLSDALGGTSVAGIDVGPHLLLATKALLFGAAVNDGYTLIAQFATAFQILSDPDAPEDKKAEAIHAIVVGIAGAAIGKGVYDEYSIHGGKAGGSGPRARVVRDRTAGNASHSDPDVDAPHTSSDEPLAAGDDSAHANRGSKHAYDELESSHQGNTQDRSTLDGESSGVNRAGAAIDPATILKLRQATDDIVREQFRKNLQFPEAKLQYKIAQQASDEAERVYAEAIARNIPEAAAKKQSKQAARSFARDAARKTALQVAEDAADRAIADGTVFDESQLTADAKAKKVDYAAGRVGGSAKRLAPELNGKTYQQLEDIMEREVAAGHASKTTSLVPDPTAATTLQVQGVYEFRDGTVVRTKPMGDALHAGEPMYSIEVKRTAPPSANPQTGIAFKISRDGTALPKGPSDVKNPYDKGRFYTQWKAFLNHVMSAGHQQTADA